MLKFTSVICFSILWICNSVAEESSRPNILWITIEDWSPDLSCYGTKGIHTPHVDKLASEGIRYETAFTTSPVCSTSRSAMMTGFHQNYIGAHQHRTDNKQPLPYGIRPVPHLFADAGYHTSIMSWKTDCNFVPNTREELFMGKDWSERNPGQPFFARITFGGTHRAWKRDPERPIDPKDIELPPYYADTPFIRRDWANGLEQMQLVDREVGALLKRLDDEGLTNNTIVFFIGDHGRCHIRGKQFLYDEGTRIPMIMRWPGKVKPGLVNSDLVMSIDICATILEAAGISAPVPLHGKNLFGKEVKQRKYVFAARDKMDDAHDAMRSIRTKEHKLILNLMPERPYCQFSHYKEGAYPPLAEMNVLNLKGQLTPEQALFFAPSKPEVEMFDLTKDPHEVHNVADDPAYAGVKNELLAALKNWRENVIKDQGVTEEFRALGVFPKSCPTSTVGEWVEQNVKNYNFSESGSPPWFPTRTLAEWEKAVELWSPYVFRGPSETVARPAIPFTTKARKKKSKRTAKAKLKRKLIFADNFEGRQTLGKTYTTGPGMSHGWVVKDGILFGKQVKNDHGSTMRKQHDFDDLDVEFDFRFNGGSRFNFVIDDKNEKSVHAGHICRVSISPKRISIGDDKMGSMNLQVRAQRQDADLDKAGKQALREQLAATQASAQVNLGRSKWYRMRIRIVEDLMEVYLDGERLTSLRSPGIAHPTKTKFGMTVNGNSIDFDNLQLFRAF